MAGESPALSGLLTGLVPGSKVSGYLLEKLVGVGGMAAVFRARDERLDRVVALKLLVGDEIVRARFVREARAIARVDHPHIIPVYEAGEAEGVLFIAMRFVAGDDLRVIVTREGAMRPRRAVGFISPVASALDAAHDAGLVHRDVKPANMLVDIGRGRPEHVYLSDFGVARGVQSEGGLTGAGQFLGTPDYAAPEQISGRTVDGRADQYALACATYALLTGAVPFQREEPMAVLYAHLSLAPPPLTSRRPELPSLVDEVVSKALAKEPDDRYPSCGEFADALRDALGVDPYDPTRPSRVLSQFRPVPATEPVKAVGPPSMSHAERTVTAEPRPSPPIPRFAPTAPLTMPPGDPPPTRRTAAATWTAVVSADRVYFDTVAPASDSDAGKIKFPEHPVELRIPLTGAEVRVGRRSVSRHLEPEIDLTGHPTDPGVSRLHAVLRARPDHTWTVTDPGSPNGILVNGAEVPPGEATPLRHGDRIHLGFWTVITITRDR